MELNQKLANDGLFFSVDPGADATIGGMASTGAAGTTTVRYGSMKENVLALTAVLADGTIIKTGRATRKLSAGYDLTRLIVGSEGTLAIITEITLRLVPNPPAVATALATFADIHGAVDAVGVPLLLSAGFDFGHVGLDGLNLTTMVALDTHVADDLPLWNEYDFIASYDLSAVDGLPRWLSPLSLNAQYALLQKDYSGGSGYVEDELRLILNYEIKSTGKDL